MPELTPDSAETISLLEQVRLGDTEAFERLLKRHRPVLRQSVSRRLSPKIRGRVDSSDIIQETEVEAFRQLDYYLKQRPMPFRLWLLRTAHQRMLKVERRHLHAAKRAAEREVPLPDRSSIQLLQAVGHGTAPSVRASRRELARGVRRCLARLREADREIVWLRNYEGLSNTEAACLLEIHPETAKKRYTRALLRLQMLLSEAGITEASP
jgi:RNA polymerase sigma-70 factor (ECF subfamily)